MAKKQKNSEIEELRKKHQEEIDAFPFMWAFSDKQFNEGMEKLGLKKDDYDSIVSIGYGGFVRKSDIPAMDEMFRRHEQELKDARKRAKDVRYLVFMGIDDFNRPVFKDPDRKAYYGSVDILFDWGESEENVLKNIEEDDLYYFGSYFGCEPMGTPALPENLRIRRH